MAEEPVRRRLTAILATDVAGFSRMMEVDEDATLAALRSRRREILSPLVAKHQGRIFKITGDGAMVEFASAVSAVQCAVELQHAMAAANKDLPADRHIVLRIGINLGDVMIEGSDLYGDGVNIAARLEGLCEPSGILVSGTTHDYVNGKVRVGFEDQGPQALKNITAPVRAWRVVGTPAANPAVLPAVADKPSIAVLPFTNMSGESEQEYFSDGVVEEIITELSRFRSLFVIARNSTFVYKGRSVDLKQVGRELGVRYVLEGSVRKAGNRVRIIGQLIDVGTGAHLWADRFEGAIENIFELQDHITQRTVIAIAPKVEQAEIERVARKSTASLDAYDCYLRGLASLHRFTESDSRDALAHFKRAFELDPNFGAAYGMAARVFVQRKTGRWINNPPIDVDEIGRWTRRAIEAGNDDAVALCAAAFAVNDLLGQAAYADNLLDRAIALNPNLAMAWALSGWNKVSLGDAETAIERVTHAMRLSPNDPYAFGMQGAMASAHLVAGRYAEALSWVQKSTNAKPDLFFSVLLEAACAGLAGERDVAEKAMTTLRAIDPELRISNLGDFVTYFPPEQHERLLEGLRMSGLPE